MSDFKFHFFKEKSRSIDIDLLIEYFEKRSFKTHMDERYLKFVFVHPTIGTSYYFMLTPKTTVPDIYRLNPKYLDVNFEFNIPVMVSNFMLDKALKDIESFCKNFNLSIYHPLFEDVLPFQYDTLLEVYKIYKKAYVKQHPEYLQSFVFINKDTLYTMSKYSDDLISLKEYFHDVQTYVPKYQFILCDQTLHIGFEWKHDVLTIIPPEANVCYYDILGQVHMIDLNHVMPRIEKFIAKVPGTIQGTHVIMKKYLKKVQKIMKKQASMSICETPLKVYLKDLMPKENA